MRYHNHDSRPVMEDLITFVIPAVATKWYTLGLELLGPKYANELETIKADTSPNMLLCCKMFQKWLNLDNLASWDKLIKALITIRLNNASSVVNG